MLYNLTGDEIRCIASDTVDCPVNLKSKVNKMLVSYGDDSTNTASLEKEIPYGGKLWRVQTLADLAENRPTANF